MKNHNKLLAVTAVVALLGFTAPAHADDTTTTTITTRSSSTSTPVLTTTETFPGVAGYKKVKHTIIRDADFPVIREYVRTRRIYCPAGVMPAAGECMQPMPTTRTITYYEPGSRLPDTVHYEVMPTTVTTRLMTPPDGAIYVTADDNLYLINPRDKEILDSLNVFADVE